MISAGLALALLVASMGFTYFFCLRPMRRGRCAMTSLMPGAVPVLGCEAEVAQLRAEVRTLRRQVAQ